MIRGSCFCGGVVFEIDGSLTPIQFCHARRCQKSTGGAFAPEVAARATDFRWIQGRDLLQHYEAPLLREPPPYRKNFCRVCGSPMPVIHDEIGFVVFLAGVLDQDADTAPFREIFLAQRASWYPRSIDLPGFDLRPPEGQRLRKAAD